MPQQAANHLVRAGYFFSATKVACSDLELLKAILEEMQLLVKPPEGPERGPPEAASSFFRWRDIDKDLFIAHFCGHSLIQYYTEIRRQIRSLKGDKVRRGRAVVQGADRQTPATLQTRFRL